ncbi:ubiquinone/menaquinone biosynthesis methyltransferase [Nitzschia inconspicua]|uniref:Ubiquinone/menaquinone biosynthesis methyltransferase n=1 Tax=Nitzschia inconspicua TaxID=303405 RepID=A0A9K3PDT9_9STRA|nr:ubiquinone/menaquinone biosynthesis methyltransferase [Nitzschia inconspicua]
MLCLSLSLILPILVAVFLASHNQNNRLNLMNMVFGSVETPPPDFGSGQMFDQIAGRYDMINRVLALRMDISWRQQMTGHIQELLRERDENTPSSTSSWKVLDMATGTADVALQLAQDLPPSTTILGLDPSNKMLAVGRQKVSAAGLENRITLQEADARDLSNYSSDTYDAATMSFGIRNVPDPRQIALCEIHRLLKPGGILGILEFSKPDDSHGVLGVLARWFIVHVVPVVGGLLSGAPREYLHLQNSIQDFPAPEEFRKLLQELQCPGYFDMEPVRHLNFGSVQLYIGRAVKPAAAPAKTTNEDEQQPDDRQQDVKKDPVLPPIKSSVGDDS